MARIRSIKPAFFLNEDVASLPLQWRLLFVGLWTQADREGRLEDRPMRLKAALFPYDDLSIDDGLGCLAHAGLIIRYELGGRKLICIPTWKRHQQPHIREPISELQPPDAGTVRASVQPVGSGKGRELIREGVHGALRARFERFWSVYPRKIGKDAAWKVWLQRAPGDDLTEQILAAVDQQARSAQWTKDGGQFIPHPRTWLSHGRWQDETESAAPNRRAVAPGRAEWRLECEALAHDPACQTPQLHELRKAIFQDGCQHPGVCQTYGDCRLLNAEEAGV